MLHLLLKGTRKKKWTASDARAGGAAYEAHWPRFELGTVYI